MNTLNSLSKQSGAKQNFAAAELPLDTDYCRNITNNEPSTKWGFRV